MDGDKDCPCDETLDERDKITAEALGVSGDVVTIWPIDKVPELLQEFAEYEDRGAEWVYFVPIEFPVPMYMSLSCEVDEGMIYVL